MCNGAQKYQMHGTRAVAPESLERDWRKLIAGAVMMALAGGGVGGVA